MQSHYTYTEPQWPHMKKKMRCHCTTISHRMNNMFGGSMCSARCHQERYSIDQPHAVESHMCLACYNGSNYPNTPHFECTCGNCVHRLRSTSRSFSDWCHENTRPWKVCRLWIVHFHIYSLYRPVHTIILYTYHICMYST